MTRPKWNAGEFLPHAPQREREGTRGGRRGSEGAAAPQKVATHPRQPTDGHGARYLRCKPRSRRCCPRLGLTSRYLTMDPGGHSGHFSPAGCRRPERAPEPPRARQPAGRPAARSHTNAGAAGTAAALRSRGTARPCNGHSPPPPAPHIHTPLSPRLLASRPR